MRFPTSSCNPGKHERHHAPNDLLQLLQCVLQPPAAVPQSCRITHTPLACSCANAFRHLQLQSQIAGASHQIEQHAQQGRFCSLRPSVFRYFFCESELSLQSRAVFGRQLCEIEHSWKHRPYLSDAWSHPTM